MSIKKAFIDFLIQHQALTFGNFTLKSGRQSPYFFNLGVFNTGKSLATLGEFYAQALVESGFPYDVLFGPAYKGIPLVSATAIALQNKHGIDVPYCFNRKEKKDHGDGGELVGSNLAGNVVMLDDVITAGTTVRETIALIQRYQANLTGIVIALDRQERDANDPLNQIPLKSIVTLQDVLSYFK